MQLILARWVGMKYLQTTVTSVDRVKYSAYEQQTKDQAGGDLSLIIEDLFPSTFFGADVDQHDHEQEKHHHAADINQDLHAGNELRAREHKQGGNRHER